MSARPEHPTDDELKAFASGKTSDALVAHLATCEPCRTGAMALALGTHPGDDEEEALVRAVLAKGNAPDLSGRPAPPVARRRIDRAIAGAGVALAAAAAVALVFLPSAPPEHALAPLYSETRPVLGRFALDLPYAPYATVRSGDGRGPDDAALAALLRSKHDDPAAAARPLAALYALRREEGDQARAEAELARAPDGAATRNDRGMVALQFGEAEAALRLFDEALALDPKLAAAAFNRAVALEALGKRKAAAEAWRTYLAVARDEPAWSDEARERLGKLAP